MNLEETVIDLFLSGEDESFECIYNFYESKINTIAYSILHNYADAEDVVQNTFIKIYLNRNQIINPKAFNSWVFKIAHTTSLDVYRKNCKIYEYQTLWYDNMHVCNSNIENKLLYQKEIFYLVNEKIKELPKFQQEILDMRYMNNMSIFEISSALGIPVGTVKSRIYYGRKLLQKKFANQVSLSDNYE